MFVWDERKRLKVLEDHRVDFALLTDAFDDPFGVYFEDVEHSTEEEKRLNLIAFSAQYGMVYVTFIYEDDSVRLITAWRAEKWAIKEYEQYKR
jgi:uncharacterized DUF497 family protein